MGRKGQLRVRGPSSTQSPHCCLTPYPAAAVSLSNSNRNDSTVDDRDRHYATVHNLRQRRREVKGVTACLVLYSRQARGEAH